MLKKAIVLLLLLGFAPAVATGDREQDQKVADQKLQKLIDDAIDRGAEWLLDSQAEDGSFGAQFGHPLGSTAISALALLHSGISHEQEVIQDAFTFMRKQHGLVRRTLRTYSASVTIMALAEFGRARGRTSGKFDLTKKDRAWLKSLVDFLVKNPLEGGGWRYPGPDNTFDHSNSQYALLALLEARKSGVGVSDEIFAKALRQFVNNQERRGPKVRRSREEGGDGVYSAGRKTVAGYDYARGWGYTGPQGVSGSMTAAGVTSVAICVSELKGNRWGSLPDAGEKAMWDGIAWLGKNFSVKDNPRGSPAWHYYYLYGLERAGVLARVVYMAGHRWYAEGAKYLVDAQGPDGAWRVASASRGGQAADPVTQSFALLFLARATARALGVATEEPLIDLTGADELSDEDHASLFKAAFAELARLAGEAATRRAGEFTFLGPRVVPLLLTKMAAEEPDVRARGVLILREITGQSKDFDPTGPEPARQESLNRWIAWYLANRPDGLLR